MLIISKKLLYAIGLCIAASLYASSPTQLKDTYRCFVPSYGHLSPLHGAQLWESGTIKTYYDASSYIQAPADQWLPRIDGPFRLTHALFTDTLGNFDISHNPNYPARHLGVSTLGEIIVLLEKKGPLDASTLEDFIIKDPEFIRSIDSIHVEHDETEMKFAKLSEQLASLQTSLIPYSRNFALNKLKVQRLHKDWTRTQQLARINARITEIDQLTGKAKNCAQKERSQLVRQRDGLQSATGIGDYNRVRELAQAIIDANTPSSFFPDNIAKWILLACMYRKAKNKSELMPYFSVLKQHMPHVCSALDETWMHKLFTPADFETIQECIVPIQKGTPGALDSSTYETLAVAQMIERYYKGPFPKIAEYYTNIVVNGATFPDCVEVTLMNLCDRVVYNKESGTFELDRIPVEQQSQLLIDFYTDPTNKQATNIHLPVVHQQWGEPLQDWPFVTYRQRIIKTKDGKTIVLSAPKDTNGFIHGLSPSTLAALPHKEDKKDYVQISGRWYIHSEEPHGYLCEMHPTIRNIIIVLDKLFNLNLFSDQPLEKAFLLEHFNADYFTRLCANFPIFQHHPWSESTLQTFDRDEYTDQGIRISFEHFDLLLTNEHAEIIANTQGNSIANLAPILLNLSETVKDVQQKWRLAQLASIFPFDVQHVPAKDAFPYLLYLPLYNNQVKIHAAAYCIHKMCEPTLPESDTDHYAQLAISCIRHLPERADWHYHIELFEMLTPEQLQHPVVKEELFRILTIAHERLKKGSSDCEYIPALYRCLIVKDQQFDMVQVTEVIDNIVARTDEFDRKPLLNLLILLTQKGHAIPQARRAIEICIHNSVEAENKLAQQLKDYVDRQKETV